MSEVKPVASDMHIAINDASLKSMYVRCAKPAFEGTPGIPERKDKDGKIVQPFRKENPPMPAVEAAIYMTIRARSTAILKEITNRLSIEGIGIKEGSETKAVEDGILATFEAKSNTIFREAFKKCKGNGIHNSRGAKAHRAERKMVNNEKAKLAKAKLTKAAKAEPEVKEAPALKAAPALKPAPKAKNKVA